MAGRGPHKMTPDGEARFLRHFELTHRVAESAAVVGMTSIGVNVHREKHPEFEERYQEAGKLYCDRLEAEIHRRAMLGVQSTVYFKGQAVGRKVEYSDRLLEFSTKKFIPEYRDQPQLGINMSGGVLVVPGIQTKDEEWEKAYRVDGDNSVNELSQKVGKKITRS